MARKGRDLERLISILEEGLASSDVLIESPDYLDDQVTEEKREVDVSIRRKDKPENILMVLECRDRRRKEDVTWIEQLYTKTRDTRVPKVVAVSSSEFSKAARLKAQYYDIELRTIEEISNENLNNWIIPSSLVKTVQHCKIIDMCIISDDTRFQDVRIPFDPTAKCLKRNEQLLSPRDLFKMIPRAKLPPIDENEEKQTSTFRFDFRKDNVLFKLHSDWLRIDGFEVIMEFWNEGEYVDSTKMFTYSDKGRKLAGGSVFPIKIGDREFNLVTHTYRTEDRQVVKFTLSPRKEQR